MGGDRCFPSWSRRVEGWVQVRIGQSLFACKGPEVRPAATVLLGQYPRVRWQKLA